MIVNEADTRHFLARVGFAPSDEDVAHFVGRDTADIVDEIISAAIEPIAPPAWIGVDPDYLANDKTLDWWLNRMRTSRWAGRTSGEPSPLIEKLSLFWHGHFATAFQKVEDAFLMFEQNQLFREFGLGDFEQFCTRISTQGAMLMYLDNETNVAGAVQENFARELMELFTMGVGNYTEFDVVEMARAWTGHGTVGWVEGEQRYDGTYEFHPEDHDDDPKTIFGITANWDGPETITEICQGARQQQTANFLATKLWRFLVNGNPPGQAIADVAAAFIAADMNLGELVRALLLRDEFWSPASRRALVKTPTQYVVDFHRCTDLAFENQIAGWSMAPMGQRLFAPPNVAGWGTNGYWLSTATMWGRAQYATDRRWSLTNETGFLVELATMDPVTGTDFLLRTFRIADPSAATKDAVEAWFAATQVNDDWALAPVGISVVALSPEFQVV